MAEGIIDEDYVSQLEEQYKASLEEKLEDSRKEDKTIITPFMQGEWTAFNRAKLPEMMIPIDTTYPIEKLKNITDIISSLPKDKKFIRKIERLLNRERSCLMKINWIGPWVNI